jgi:D-methionine transport system substrate-binding protein
VERRISIIAVLIITLLSTSPVSAETILKVGATPLPHAEILAIIAPKLAEEGIILEIMEFTDYVRPNRALYDQDLDANFFQHTPYLLGFNEDAGTDLVPSVGVFVAPLGVYSQKIKSLNDLTARAQIAIPNDATNGSRALLLLEEAGVIKLNPAATSPTIFDITENRLNLKIHELEAPQLARSLPDVAAAIINVTWALEAGLHPVTDSIWLEGAESRFVNILAVRADNANDPAILKLAEALVSDEVREYINDYYSGSIVPVF